MAAHVARHVGRPSAPPVPPADPAELIGIPPGRTAYRMPSRSRGRHRPPSRMGTPLAVVGGVAGVAATAVSVKVGATAAVSSLALSLENLIR